MQAGVRQAAPELASPADVRSESQPTRGQKLGGRYTYDRLLARTAGAAVWRVVGPGSVVFAAKLPRRMDDPAQAAAVRREHACLERLDHPHIVTPIELIESPAGPVLVLELLEHGDLVSLAGFAMRHWCEPLGDVARALEYLHSRGLVHRDVKARNVRLTADGRGRLIDFGSTARAGALRRGAGTTAAHAVPGATGVIGPADDVHALAVLAYQLLTGMLPFGADGRRGVVPPRPRVSADAAALLELVMTALDPAAGRSAPTAAAFAAAAEAAR